MLGSSERKKLKSDFVILWVIQGSMILTLAVYIFLCLYLGEEIRVWPDREPPILIRTILYAVSIITFPLINLLRHIMLRLNQTMPGDTSARSRYFTTVLVSLAFGETMGVYGLVLYVLGDNLNTLYIFCFLSVLAMILYGPKLDEYEQVVEALKRKSED